jgi:hypothetical protein
MYFRTFVKFSRCLSLYCHDNQTGKFLIAQKMLRALNLNIISNTIMKKFLLGLFFAVTCLLVAPNVSNAATDVSKPVQIVHKTAEKKVVMGTQKDLATIPSESIVSIKQVVQEDVIIIIIETDCCIIIIIIS